MANKKNFKKSDVKEEVKDEVKEEVKEEVKDEVKQEVKDEEKKGTFSKNSIINISRKSGIKCISQGGIEKIKDVLNDKIKTLAEKLAVFYSSKNGKTVTKKLVLQFLESEGVNITSRD